MYRLKALFLFTVVHLPRIESRSDDSSKSSFIANPTKYFPDKVNSLVKAADAISTLAKPLDTDSYPAIDIGPWMFPRSSTEEEREEIVDKVLIEATRTGSFNIIGHGVDTDFLDHLDFMTKSFFDLPLDKKLKYSTANNKIGYVPNQAESVSAIYSGGKDNEAKDLREIYSMIYPPLHPENVNAPHQKVLHQFIDKVQPVEKALNQIFTAVLNKVNAIRLQLDYLQEAQGGATGLLRSVRYPTMPSEYDDAKRLLAHSDWGTFTILYSSHSKGLEEIREGEWVQVPFAPGHLHVNIGEVLAMWSNEVFQNNVHRVSSQAEGGRTAFAYFASQGIMDDGEGIHPITPNGVAPRFPRISCSGHASHYLSALFGETDSSDS